MLKDRENIDITHIPYNGIMPNLTALAAGDVQLASASASVIMPLVQAGKITPIAVAGDAPILQFPKVTTTTQQGYPYAKVSIWYGLFAPKGTPPEIVNRLNADIAAVLRDDAFAEQQVSSKGLTVMAGSTKDFAEAIKQDAALVGEMVKAANVTPE